MKKGRIVKKGILITLAFATAMLTCGCMISSGAFTNINRSYGDNYLSADYGSFNGSLARRVSLKEGDTVTFYYEGSGALSPVVKKGGEVLCEVSDGAGFTAPEDGSYDFAVQGRDKDGEFMLCWETE